MSGETGEAAPPAPAPPQHISLPPYMAGIPIPGPQGGIPLPGPQGAQHIHINNFTANLNFPPAPATTANSSQSGKGVLQMYKLFFRNLPKLAQSSILYVKSLCCFYCSLETYKTNGL